MRSLLAIILSSSLLWSSAGGQLEEDFRPVEFTVVAPVPLADLAFPVWDGEGGVAEWQPLRFYTTGRSPLYRYEGPFPVRFHALPAETGGGEDSPRRVVASWTPPSPDEDRWLLFFFPSDSAEGGLRLRSVPDGPARFPAGHLRFFRATGLELACRVAEARTGESRELRLSVGASEPVPFAGGGRVECRTPWRGRWRMAYADRIELEETERVVVVLLPPFAEGSLQPQVSLLWDRSEAPVGASPAEGPD